MTYVLGEARLDDAEIQSILSAMKAKDGFDLFIIVLAHES